MASGESKGSRRYDKENLLWQFTVAIKSYPVGSVIWWTVLDSSGGWKLEKNKVTGHCRIIDPDKLRKAWGRESEMRTAFEKVKNQLK